MGGAVLQVVLALLATAACQEGEPVIGDELRWEDVASWRDVPHGAVWCGYQYPNNDTSRRERSYVSRVYRLGNLIPGKATYWGAGAALGSSVFNNVPTFEVAVVHSHHVLWVAAAGGNVPHTGTAVAGITKEGQPLFACRFHLDRHLSMACGAVLRYTERCVAELDGTLVTSPVYEVLTITQGFDPPPLPGPPGPAGPRSFMQDDVAEQRPAAGSGHTKTSTTTTTTETNRDLTVGSTKSKSESETKSKSEAESTSPKTNDT